MTTAKRATNDNGQAETKSVSLAALVPSVEAPVVIQPSLVGGRPTRIKGTGETRRFVWVVEFEVSETWVADGFDLDDERAETMLQTDLAYARSDEIGARVIRAPAPTEIRKAQGYKS